MDVSIIIVNYNTISLLVDAINSIFEKTKDIEFEIIVVDNNSDDNSKEILAKKYGNNIIYIGLSENIGFGRANNEAAKKANGRNLFFLNPDTILLNNAVKILSDYLDNNSDVGCCGGNLYNENKNPTTSFYRVLPSLSVSIDNIFYSVIQRIMFGKNRYFNFSDKNIEVAAIIGADMMIKESLFKKLKGFDSDFFLFAEEVELDYRIMKAGYKLYNIPKAKILHLEGKSLSNDDKKNKMYKDAYFLYLNKTQNKINIIFIKTFDIIYYISRIIIFTLINNKEKLLINKLGFKLVINNYLKLDK